MKWTEKRVASFQFQRDRLESNGAGNQWYFDSFRYTSWNGNENGNERNALDVQWSSPSIESNRIDSTVEEAAQRTNRNKFKIQMRIYWVCVLFWFSVFILIFFSFFGAFLCLCGYCFSVHPSLIRPSPNIGIDDWLCGYPIPRTIARGNLINLLKLKHTVCSLLIVFRLENARMTEYRCAEMSIVDAMAITKTLNIHYWVLVFMNVFSEVFFCVPFFFVGLVFFRAGRDSSFDFYLHFAIADFSD